MITTEQSIAWAREQKLDWYPSQYCWLVDDTKLTALCNLAYAKGLEDAGKGQEPVAMNGFNGLVESCERNRLKRDVRSAVDKFLCWKLPKDFCPDAGIKYSAAYEYDSPYWPIGTNLLTAIQAKAMFEYCLEGTGYVVHPANDQLRTDRDALMTAVKNLLEQKGRHNTEIAYSRLMSVFATIEARSEE